MYFSTYRFTGVPTCFFSCFYVIIVNIFIFTALLLCSFFLLFLLYDGQMLYK